MVFCSIGSGLGAGRCRRVIFAGDVHVCGSRAARGRIDVATTNGVCWGSHAALVVAVLYFLELDANLEVLGSGRNTGLTEGEVGAIWSQVCEVANSLESHIPSSVARNPPNSAGE
jgi:hypothetical protein